jgi:hypothetical protein
VFGADLFAQITRGRRRRRAFIDAAFRHLPCLDGEIIVAGHERPTRAIEQQ